MVLGSKEASKPIGMFDSGVGGLSIALELLKQLPGERIIYFGDTANVPYGEKSESQLIALADRITFFLVQKGVKAVVDACNSTSSVALDYLKERYELPIIGVIEPGVREAIERTKNGRIGVIATTATIMSSAHKRAAQKLDPSVKVFGQACPKFVPLVEAGKVSCKEAENACFEYLMPLVKKRIDTLILGCTHYPFLIPVIRRIVGPEVAIVDPAVGTIRELKEILEKKNMRKLSQPTGFKEQEYYVSGDPILFKEVGEKLIGTSLGRVFRVAIDDKIIENIKNGSAG
ncbi:MAG: Glutamate racemase [Clostridia bacterium 41_269]|nr:MAG: Glutamate racemase [Clostridia bacterium 41_269]